MNLLDVAFFAPEIVGGAKNTRKNVSKQLSGQNKYDVKLGNNIPQIKPPSRYPQNNSIGSPNLMKSAAIEYIENSRTPEVSNENTAKYLVPAALLAAGATRAAMTGNALQLGEDVGRTLHKVNFAPSLRKSKNPMLSTFRFYEKKRLDGVPTAKRGDRLKATAQWAAAMTAADLITRGVAGDSYTKNWQQQYDDAQKNIYRSENGRPSGKQAADIPEDMIKVAKEVPGFKGWAQKTIREGIEQPAISAVPILAVPSAVSYVANKDIRGDFGPVREESSPTFRDKLSERGKTILDPQSVNNVVVNQEILHNATEAAIGFAKNASFSVPKFRKPWKNLDGTEKIYHIKDWGEFASELPMIGLRATSIALPTAFLVKYDPVSQYKKEQSKKQQKAIEKSIINKSVRRAVNKVEKDLEV